MRILTILVVGVALCTAQARAQGFGQFDDPTDMTYTEYLWPLCIDPLAPDNGYVAASCLGDPTNENTTREEVKAEDRWLRAALLLAAQIEAGLSSLRNIIQSGREMVHGIESLLHGGDRRPPSDLAIRIIGATDAESQRLRQAATLALSTPFSAAEPRYADVHAVVLRALGTAHDGAAQSSALASQASVLQARLDTGHVRFLEVGNGSLSFESGALPPLASDAAANALEVYSTIVRSFPTTVATWTVASSLTPGGGGSLSAGPAASADTAGCPLTDDITPTPQTMYERASVEARGAQASTAATSAALQQARDQVQAIRQREAQAEEEGRWLGVVRFLHSL